MSRLFLLNSGIDPEAFFLYLTLCYFSSNDTIYLGIIFVKYFVRRITLK
jgi:hypothetical protein